MAETTTIFRLVGLNRHDEVERTIAFNLAALRRLAARFKAYRIEDALGNILESHNADDLPDNA